MNSLLKMIPNHTNSEDKLVWICMQKLQTSTNCSRIHEHILYLYFLDRLPDEKGFYQLRHGRSFTERATSPYPNMFIQYGIVRETLGTNVDVTIYSTSLKIFVGTRSTFDIYMFYIMIWVTRFSAAWPNHHVRLQHARTRAFSRFLQFELWDSMCVCVVRMWQNVNYWQNRCSATTKLINHRCPMTCDKYR